MLTLRAYAKLTLSLEVVGRRPDGYHEVKGVLQSISLHDTLTFRPAEGIRLAVDTPGLAGAGNLVLAAARHLAEDTGARQGALITLSKGVPWGAGLGSGSGDAATTLHGLSRLWGLGLDTEALSPMAAAIGSDVPFCLRGGTALVEGRGERVSPLPSPAGYVVLVVPPMSLEDKTRRMFAALRPSNYTDGAATLGLADALRRGQAVGEGALLNVFEPVAWRLFPGLEEYRRRFLEVGARGVHLAGAGPTLFALEAEPGRAATLHQRLLREGVVAFVASFVPRP